MEHWLPCIPPKVSHHAKRIVRVGKFARLADKAELTAARGDLIVMLQQIAPPMALDPTGSEPYRLELTYYWPYLTTDPKSFKVKRWLIPHITKPDCDNIAKTFIDCLVRTGTCASASTGVPPPESISSWRWSMASVRSLWATQRRIKLVIGEWQKAHRIFLSGESAQDLLGRFQSLLADLMPSTTFPLTQNPLGTTPAENAAKIARNILTHQMPATADATSAPENSSPPSGTESSAAAENASSETRPADAPTADTEEP
jgi:Holliday junction resolvase RusA-like endonuclease